MLGYPPGTDPPGADTPFPPGAGHAGRYGQRAGGTHHTGMQSCNSCYSICLPLDAVHNFDTWQANSPLQGAGRHLRVTRHMLHSFAFSRQLSGSNFTSSTSGHSLCKLPGSPLNQYSSTTLGVPVSSAYCNHWRLCLTVVTVLNEVAAR